jgi:hypothetical protein
MITKFEAYVPRRRLTKAVTTILNNKYLQAITVPDNLRGAPNFQP